jgi:hypothetical protein
LGVKSLFLTFGKNLGTGLEITHFPLIIPNRQVVYSLNFSGETSHVLKEKELRQCVKYRTNLISRRDWQN